MFKITIEGATMAELAANVEQFTAELTGNGTSPAPKPRVRKAATPVEPEQTGTTASTAPSEEQEDGDLQAELSAPVEPMPEAAKAIVDAGTGKPAAPAADEPIKMTFEDVKVAAAKLAAKDTPKLGEILKSYGAGKLSEVPPAKLGDFASDVMEALG
jgi:hypothetical protein